MASHFNIYNVINILLIAMEIKLHLHKQCFLTILPPLHFITKLAYCHKICVSQFPPFKIPWLYHQIRLIPSFTTFPETKSSHKTDIFEEKIVV